jgi:putative ABC transport system substrate-binding protein
MHRREFIALLAAASWPIVVRAQPIVKIARIGFLGAASPSEWASKVEALRAGLRDLGYIEGKNIVIEFRWAEGKYDRLPMLARGLAALDVDVLVTHTTPGVRAAKQATTRIPIVIAAVGDAVAAGLVESIARPGGNITGSSFFVPELASKRLGLLKEAFPHVKRVGILFNPVGIVQTATWGDAMASAAKSLAIEMQEIPVREPEHFEGALVSAVDKGIDALAMSEDPVLVGNARPIVDVVARLRLPAIGFPEFGEAGGLMAYGASIVEMHRLAAAFIDKILKGAKPAELPVQQPTKFELIINLRTAKALGLMIPPALLARADEVIE